MATKTINPRLIDQLEATCSLLAGLHDCSACPLCPYCVMIGAYTGKECVAKQLQESFEIYGRYE